MAIWEAARQASIVDGLDATRELGAADARVLLGAYAWGALSPDEDRRVHVAALDDQEFFDALAEDDLLKQALEDNSFRERVKTRLRELNGGPTSGWGLGRGGLFKRRAAKRFASVIIAGVVCATCALFEARGPRGVRSDWEAIEPVFHAKPLPTRLPTHASADKTEAAFLKWLWETGAPGAVGGIELALNQSGQEPVYEEGEPVRIAFSLPVEGAAVLLCKEPAGTVRQPFPNEHRLSSYIRGKEWVEVPGMGHEIKFVEGPIGEYGLRLLVFAVDADPLRSGVDGVKRPVAVDRAYSVIKRTEPAD